MTQDIDLSSITLDDLIEEYKILRESHQQLKEKSETDTQRIYALKRSLDTAHAAEAYLTQELEQLSAQTSNNSDSDIRAQQEVEELRHKNRQLQFDFESLQQDYETKAALADQLNVQLAEVQSKYAEKDALGMAATTHVDCLEQYAILEADNMELLEKLEQYQNNGVQHTFDVAEKEKTIDILSDQVCCLKENLRGKRDEVEEKAQMLEAAQEQLVEANAKIAALSTAPEIERKGNSLFAEVDDQRQAMKKLLAAQKKTYLEMKKSYVDSEFEIRRLKRQNLAMHTELKTCSTIFCKADKVYHDKLNERIRQLLNQQDLLEKKLQWTQERLRDLAKEKAVDWLDSMLNFCKEETDEYKKELYSIRIHNAYVEEQLRNSQQQLARWRFESLKSRCVLIDRENLLTEHNISFKPNTALEFDIKEAQLQAARPRIMCAPKERTSLTAKELPTKLLAGNEPAVVGQQKPEQTQLDVQVLSTKAIKQEPVNEGNETINTAFATLNINSELEAYDDLATLIRPKAYNPPTPMKSKVMKTTQSAEKTGLQSEKSKLDIVKSQLQPALTKLNINTKFDADDNLGTLVSPKAYHPPTPMKSKAIKATQSAEKTKSRSDKSPLQPLAVSTLLPNNQQSKINKPSSLAKQRDIFDEGSKRKVHFSAEAPIVHNISITSNDTSDLDCKANQASADVEQTGRKSKVVVRHIKVGGVKKERM